MNGLPLLLLASTVGMDFGWQPAVDNPNVLEYIIQLSPEEVQLLNSGKEELFSGIPQELKGRIDRVVIRMGREKLPQEPSLEKLRTMAAVGGNPSILNAGGSASGTTLTPPALSSSAPLSTQGGLATIDPPRTLPSFSSAASPAPAPPISYANNYDVLASGAYEDLLRQGTTFPPGSSSSSGVSPSGFSSNGLAANNPASGGATTPSGLAAENRNTLGDASGIPAIPVTQLGSNNGTNTFPSDPRLAFQGNNGSTNPSAISASNNSSPTNMASGNSSVLPPGSGSILPGGNAMNNGSTLPAGGWNSANNSANTTTNPPRGPSAANPVGFNNNSVAGNTLGNSPQILPPGNSGLGFGNPGGSMQTASPSTANSQFGTNPTLIASSTTSGSSFGSSSAFDEDDEVSASTKEEAEGATSATLSASNWEKVLQILFILSVVLNFYLGVHLHKLLLRYRTLLSSVRASATIA